MSVHISWVPWLFISGIRTDEPAVFGNSWAVDLPHERACPSVDLDFNGPCESESDMDVRTTEEVYLFSKSACIHLHTCKLGSS